ncbi:MAG: sigma-54-dependent Fis family transcriptional regulator [Deltaproteobacteria bacterium]|nr:sigma-54-dependent Fis family transcriptional regulator [Deltaproteobacteria bacterium]
MARSVLVVDDEQTILDTLSGVLSDEGFEVMCALDGERALALVEESRPDLVLLDIWMPNLDGLATLERLKADKPYLQVVMMSGAGTIETAVKATKLGAFDYIEKPLSYEKIMVVVNNALAFARLTEENILLRQKSLPRLRLTGRSVAIEEIRRQIEIVGPTSAWVLLTGESGTGKAVVAHLIHAHSDRAERPMVEVNCAAIPEEMIESELFGQEKGAAVGARGRRQGKFDLAHRGTLFLDEIADMSLKTQAKVLRILQEQRFERVGGGRAVSVDVRVVAATSRDLQAEVEAGRFRTDLFYRLNVIPIELPPLRQRPEDIEDLAAEFLAESCANTNRPLKTITPEAFQTLGRYPWPGNIQELKNLVERLVILAPSEEITGDDLPRPYRPAGLEPATEKIRQDEWPTLKAARQAFERRYIADALARHGANVSAAAEALGIERSYLYKKMNALGLKSGGGEAKG